MDTSDVIAIIMSGLAIFFSTIVGLRQIWLSKRQNGLDERLVKVEERRFEIENEERQKADVRGHFQKVGSGRGSMQIFVENVGVAHASNISIAMSEIGLQHTVEKLLPNERLMITQFFRDNRLSESGTVHITWENPSGQPGNYSKTVSL